MRTVQKCKIRGCDNRHKARGFCERHYAQFRNSIIDENGGQLRNLHYDPSAGCVVKDCEGRRVGRGFCMRHYVQFRRGSIDENGSPIRMIRQYDSERSCKIEGCSRTHYGRGFCNKHYERFKVGIIDEDGFQIRSYKGEPDRLCEVEGCQNGHHARGLCMKHYHRWLREQKPFLVDKGMAAHEQAAREFRREDRAVLGNADVFSANEPQQESTIVFHPVKKEPVSAGSAKER